MRAPLLLFAMMAALAWFIAGCPKPPTPPPNPPPAALDGGSLTCADACERLTQLGCAGANATPQGASCLDFCQNAADGMVPWNLACITYADSCRTANNCPEARRQ